MPAEILRFTNPLVMYQALADQLVRIVEESYKQRCKATIALAGGNTPRPLYELLAREPYASSIPWTHTHLFWGDERYVPADHPDSNFGMAAATLLTHVPIPAQNFNPMPTELSSAAETALAYEQKLRTLFDIFSSLTPHDDFPVFDLILLGLGSDGHTASLFAESPALQEQRRWVVATPVPPLVPQVPRLTLTFPVINAARNVFFLVTGPEKQVIVQAILESPRETWNRYPAARVNPARRLVWFLANS
jgi:6-phosphogluconolactonase